MRKVLQKRIKIKNRKEEAGWLLEEIEHLLQRRRGYISRLEGKSAVILMSGGMDSTVIVDMLMDKTPLSLFPLFVKRGARAEKYEEKSFDYFYDFFSRRYPGRFLNSKKIAVEVPPAEFKKYRDTTQLKNLGHPMRNVMLQALGVQYAYRLGADIGYDIRTVIVATTPDDFFPHSSLLATRVASLMVCVDTGDWRWNVVAPLIDTKIWKKEICKRELILWAKEKGIPIQKTRTCTENVSVPCGKCVECRERLVALKSADHDHSF